MQDGIVVCTADLFTSKDDGTPLSLRSGDVWAADDPYVKAHPEYFGDVPESKIHRSAPAAAKPQPPKVERATRAPGERRGPGHTRKGA